MNALSIVIRASNPTTKLAAAEDFLSRYPKSKNRIKLAQMVSEEIRKVPNPAAALTLLDRAATIFTSADETRFFTTIRLDALLDSGQTDDGFRLATQVLKNRPDDVSTWIKLTFAGAEEAKRRNLKYADLSLEYGTKAIRLIEMNQPPAGVDEQEWTNLRSELGALYQATALLYLAQENTSEASSRVARAIATSPGDPANYALLGRLLQTDYERIEQNSNSRSSPIQHEQVDQIIEAYARAAGLAMGRIEYQKLLQQVIPDLTRYYKTRHNDSTQGLQQLIDRYQRVP
jgi:tetratricopeptide (TPR) repeat protein